METRPSRSSSDISPRECRDSEWFSFPGGSLLAFEEALQNAVSSPWCFCLAWPIIVMIFFISGISAFMNFSLFQSHGFRFVLQAGDWCQILLFINYCQRQPPLLSASCWMNSLSETSCPASSVSFRHCWTVSNTS